MKRLLLASVVVSVIGLLSIAALGQESASKVINGGVLNGKAVSLPKPEYPETAKAAGVEGVVKVEVTIDENGTVESAQAIKQRCAD
jgi:outer membrane biosynthesis protein TonB